MSPDKGKFATRMAALEAEYQKSRNIPELELQRIFRLSSDQVVVGLSEMLQGRIVSLLADTELSTTEQEWQLNAYFAVDSLLGSYNPDTFTDMYYGRGEYKPTITRVLRYMKFFGFSDSELSADGIFAANDEADKSLNPERREREEGVIVLDLRRQTEPRIPKTLREEYLERRVQELEEKLNKALGIDLEAEDNATVFLLDGLMNNFMFDKFPSCKEYNKILETFSRLVEKPTKSSNSS